MNKDERKVVVTGVSVVGEGYVNSGLLSNEDLPNNALAGGTDFLISRLEEYIPYRMLRRICRFSQLALLSHLICKDNARIKIENENTRIGSIMNTAYGPLNVTEKILNTIIYNGPNDVSPMEFSNTVNNCATGQVSLALKLKGDSSTLIGSSAITYAYDIIRYGKSDALFVSGVEEKNNHVQEIASKYNSEICENASCILMESLGHAKERGAQIYAEIEECDVLYLQNFDNLVRGMKKNIVSFADGRIKKEISLDNESLYFKDSYMVSENMLGATEVYNCIRAISEMASRNIGKGTAVSVQPGGCCSMITLKGRDR